MAIAVFKTEAKAKNIIMKIDLKNINYAISLDDEALWKFLIDRNTMLAVTSDSKENKKESEVAVCPDCGGKLLKVRNYELCETFGCKWGKANVLGLGEVPLLET